MLINVENKPINKTQNYQTINITRYNKVSKSNCIKT